MRISNKLEIYYSNVWFISAIVGCISIYGLYQLCATSSAGSYRKNCNKTRKGDRKVKKLDKGGQPAGIVNFSNDCFKNALIQALASLSKLEKYLFMLSKSGHTSLVYGKALANTCRAINILKSNQRIIQLNRLLAALKLPMSTNHFFEKFRQEDTHEYFLVLMDKIVKETKTVISDHRTLGRNASLSNIIDIDKTNNDESDITANIHHRIKFQKEDAKEENYKLSDNFPLMATLVNSIHCRDCNYVGPLRKEKMTSFVINLPYISTTTFQQLVNSISDPIHLQDYHCDMCTLNQTIQLAEQSHTDKTTNDESLKRICCDIKSLYISLDDDEKRNLDLMKDIPSTLKSLLIKKRPILGSVKISGLMSCPENLVFHLARIVYMPDGRLKKNACYVKVDEIIDIKQLVEPKKDLSRSDYRLCSVIVHLGTSQSGHYITYRRINDSSADWFMISDDSVQSVGQKWENINVQGDVCMTMYEKM